MQNQRSMMKSDALHSSGSPQSILAREFARLSDDERVMLRRQSDAEAYAAAAAAASEEGGLSVAGTLLSVAVGLGVAGAIVWGAWRLGLLGRRGAEVVTEAPEEIMSQFAARAASLQ